LVLLIVCITVLFVLLIVCITVLFVLLIVCITVLLDPYGCKMQLDK
jgi:hypothetical protein